MKKICILGSTGSIGMQTLEVCDQHDDIEVVSLCCKKNIKSFEKQVRAVKPKKICIYDENEYKNLKEAVSDLDIEIFSGMEGINTIVSDDDVEMIVSGISGMIGIEPTLTAIKAGKDIALANKETLVCAGNIVTKEARLKGVKIIPVDSEHSAIYQSLAGSSRDEIEKILLTASGGPFRGYSLNELSKVTKAQALNHPNWEMGPKITIDSSTLINKGLEVIEAAYLFNVGTDKIEVVVHPQSIIHSMVQFVDGAIIAQLGVSSMKVPIQYAIYDGIRKNLDVGRVDFFELQNMTFEKPNIEVFKGLKLCIDAYNIGGTMPAVLNAANEIAVEKFLNDKIRYLDIVDNIEKIMSVHEVIKNPTIEDIYESIRWVEEKLC